MKVYNLCRVKTDILTMLTVKSGLDPHMIIELEVDLNRCFTYGYVVYLRIYLSYGFNGIYLYLVNAC